MQNDAPQINVFNRQRRIRLDTQPLRDFSRALARRMKVEQDFTVTLVSDRAIRGYNRRFAARDRATDVLSFPNRLEEWEPAGECYLGDILISVESADRQKEGTLMEELQVLTLHGLLHLLGYDHETDRGEMAALEKSLRKELQLH